MSSSAQGVHNRLRSRRRRGRLATVSRDALASSVRLTVSNADGTVTRAAPATSVSNADVAVTLRRRGSTAGGAGPIQPPRRGARAATCWC